MKKYINKNDCISITRTGRLVIVGNSEIPFECNTIRVEYLTKTRTYVHIVSSGLYHEYIYIYIIFFKPIYIFVLYI